MSHEITQSMRVSVRVRPPPPNTDTIAHVTHNTIEIVPPPLHPHKSRRDRFTFDHVFDGHMPDVDGPEEVVYTLVALPSIQKTIEGYSTCLFAYGQTGSGKTRTMMGPPATPSATPGGAATPMKAARASDARERGIIPRALQHLFTEVGLKESDIEVGHNGCRRGIQHTTLAMSLIEIYNEDISCLLRPTAGTFTKSTGTRGARGGGGERRCQLRESPTEGPYIEGNTTVGVTNAEDALAVYDRAVRHRHTAATSQNAHSSRSHLILTLTLLRKKYASTGMMGDVVVTSKSAIHLIDLAGSERVGRNSIKDGSTRLVEGITINQSLLALGTVLECLAQRATGEAQAATLPPYRDSKLTFLLKEALGGDSLCHMVATVHNLPETYHETLSTLSFADRVKHITNHATARERLHDKHRIIAELSAELTVLRRENAMAGGGVARVRPPGHGTSPPRGGDVAAVGGEAFLLQVLPLPLTGGNRIVAFALPPGEGDARHIELAASAPASGDTRLEGPICLVSDRMTNSMRIATVYASNGVHTIANRAPKPSPALVAVDGETIGETPVPIVVGSLVALRAAEVDFCFRYVSLSTPSYAARLLRGTSMERRDMLGSTPRIRSAVKNDTRTNRGASVESTCESLTATIGAETLLRELYPPSAASHAPTLHDLATAQRAVGSAGVVSLDNVFLDGDQWVTFAPQPDLFAEFDPAAASPIVAFTMPVRVSGASLVLRSTALSDFAPCSITQTMSILRHMRATQTLVTEYCTALPALAQRAVTEPLPPRVVSDESSPPVDVAPPTDRALSKALHVRMLRTAAGSFYACCQPFDAVVRRGDVWTRTTMLDWNLSSLCVRLNDTTLRALLDAHASLEEFSEEGAALSREWRLRDAQRGLDVAQLQQQLEAEVDHHERLEAEREDICHDLRSRLDAVVEDWTNLRRTYDIAQIAADQQAKTVGLLNDVVGARDSLIADLRAEVDDLQEEKKASTNLIVAISSAKTELEAHADVMRESLEAFEATAEARAARVSVAVQASISDPHVDSLRERFQEAVKAHDQQRVKALDALQEASAASNALRQEQEHHRQTQRHCEELGAALKEREKQLADASHAPKVAPKGLRPRTVNTEAPLPDGVLQQRIASLKKDKAAVAAELEVKTKACHRYDAELTMLRTELRKIHAGGGTTALC